MQIATLPFTFLMLTICELGSNMATVYASNGHTIREVKNLGWLLRHSGDVEHISVNTDGYTDIIWLHAHLKDGTIFQTTFASKIVARKWLDRPRFRGILCTFYGTRFNI